MSGIRDKRRKLAASLKECCKNEDEKNIQFDQSSSASNIVFKHMDDSNFDTDLHLIPEPEVPDIHDMDLDFEDIDALMQCQFDMPEDLNFSCNSFKNLSNDKKVIHNFNSLAEGLLTFFVLFNISSRAMEFLLQLLTAYGVDCPKSLYLLKKTMS